MSLAHPHRLELCPERTAAGRPGMKESWKVDATLQEAGVHRVIFAAFIVLAFVP